MTRFVRTLRISADGSDVARLACGEPFGRCVLDVLRVSTGEIATYPTPGSSGDLTAIGDGVALGSYHCLDDVRCVTEGFGLDARVQLELPGRVSAVDEEGAIVLLQFPSPAVSAREFFMTALDGDDLRLVLATDGDLRPLYQEGLDAEGVRVELPHGWVAVVLSSPAVRGNSEPFHAAVRLRDGGWIALDLPALFPVGGGHD